MRMHHLLGTVAALSVVAIAAPAAAQYSNNNQQQGYSRGSGGQYDSRGYGNPEGMIASRIERLQERLQAGIQSGSITRSEAMPLRQQLRALSQLERQYGMDGQVNGQERADLQRRLRDLRMGIRMADGGNRARWDAYDREDEYGRDGYRQDGYNQGSAYGRGYDGRNTDDGRYRDGNYDRNYDRDGSMEDDRYQVQQPARGGLNGIVDALLGRGGLQVGQRAPSELYGLPTDYRDQYRDNSRAYYRTDGRRIYEIDNRSQTVVRIYQMGR